MTLGPLMVDIDGLSLTPEDRELLQHPLVGGIILFSRNVADREQVRALTGEIRALRDPAILIAVDQEGGRVQRFRDDFSALPPLRWLGHLYDEDPTHARAMTTRVARIMAQEVLDVGVDFSFAPVLDLGDRSVVIGDRAFAADSAAIIELSDAYVAGMHDAGMAATGKHFFNTTIKRGR